MRRKNKMAKNTALIEVEVPITVSEFCESLAKLNNTFVDAPKITKRNWIEKFILFCFCKKKIRTYSLLGESTIHIQYKKLFGKRYILKCWNSLQPLHPNCRCDMVPMYGCPVDQQGPNLYMDHHGADTFEMLYKQSKKEKQ